MNLIIEIGGTNVRFTAASMENKSVLQSLRIAPCNQFNGVEDAINWYLGEIKQTKINILCLAIAGPAEGPIYQITNRSWIFDSKRLQVNIGANQVEIINDFTALAYAIPQLSRNELLQVREGQVIAGKPKLVLGPGTGMGMATLIPTNKQWYVLPSEGGNIGFSPSNKLEVEILNHLHKTFDRVIIEDLLCGSGLELLYQTLCVIRKMKNAKLTAAQITEKALNKSDPLCIEVVELFCGMLGEYAGDMALTIGATGGVYLGGGILPRISSLLLNSTFSIRFSSKRKVSHLLKKVPVSLIMATEPALMGANYALTVNY